MASNVEGGALRTPMLFGRIRTWLMMVAFVTVLAGVLFGYDQGVIAGALGEMTASFDLSTRMHEVVASRDEGEVAGGDPGGPGGARRGAQRAEGFDAPGRPGLSGLDNTQREVRA